MKLKVFVLLAALSIFASCEAQTGPTQMYGTKWGTQGDTIINTGVANDSIGFQRSYSSTSILALVTKVSGTVSPTLLLQGSVDGTHWTTFGQDTAVLSNASGTFAFTWQLPGRQTQSNSNGHPLYASPPTLPYLYYRVNATGTGTMRAILKSYIVLR